MLESAAADKRHPPEPHWEEKRTITPRYTGSLSKGNPPITDLESLYFISFLSYSSIGNNKNPPITDKICQFFDKLTFVIAGFNCKSFMRCHWSIDQIGPSYAHALPVPIA